MASLFARQLYFHHRGPDMKIVTHGPVSPVPCMKGKCQRFARIILRLFYGWWVHACRWLKDRVTTPDMKTVIHGPVSPVPCMTGLADWEMSKVCQNYLEVILWMVGLKDRAMTPDMKIVTHGPVSPVPCLNELADSMNGKCQKFVRIILRLFYEWLG